MAASPRPASTFRRLLFVLALCFNCQSAVSCRAESTTELVAMRDGCKLATDVYLPAKAKDGEAQKFSTILIRTPYNKAGSGAIARNLLPLGYAVVAQDMRGRFASEGKPVIIFGNEGLGGGNRDGHDTIAWIAEQPWSNGKIATWGGSALGITQNMSAPDAPPALKGQIVSVAFSNFYEQCAYQGGVWRKELLEGWLKAQKIEEGNLPTFLEHATYDDFWRELNAEAHAEKVNAPGVFVGGWYDIFLQGSINSFVTIQERGGPDARGKCFLVVGPLAHGAFTHKTDYPNAAKSPLNFFAPMNVLEHWLKAPREDVAKIQPVHYYVMGDTTVKGAPGNYWRSADSWPPPSQPTPYYLQPDNRLAKSPPTGDGSRAYEYDPANPVPTIGGQNLLISKGPMDQTEVEARPDVLVFTTETLTEPLEITGRITAKLFISSDCPDTDFTVKLCDVFPDGRSMLVTDGIRRASLRNSFEKRELLEPGEVYEVEVDLWSTSLIFNRGHKIRVAVSSSNAPRFEPNANTGESHFQPGKGKIAKNTVHFSSQHPSQITLPIYTGPDQSK